MLIRTASLVLPHEQARLIDPVDRKLIARLREADFEPFIARFIQQAEAQYAEWPLVA